MADREDQPLIPPPPMRQRGVPRPPGVPNEFGELVKRGFGLGVGIWLAFAALSAVVWLAVAVLFTLALSG